MSNPQNEAAVRRLIDLLAQPSVPSDLGQFVTPDWVNRDESLEAAMGHPLRGFEGLRELYSVWKPFSDMKVTIENICSDGQWVACHFRLRGRNTGEFMGMPATGKSIDFAATGMFRCQDGKVAENIVNPDLLSLLQQLGVLQMPSQRKAA